jgi:RNA-directed DNA polymerase
MRLSPLQQVTYAIADAMLAGPAESDSIVERMTRSLGGRSEWMTALASKVAKRFGSRWDSADRKEVSMLIAGAPGFVAAWRSDVRPVIVQVLRKAPIQRLPPPRLREVALPQLPTLGDLASWLEVEVNDLEWLADRWRVMPQSAGTPLHHYSYKAKGRNTVTYAAPHAGKAVVVRFDLADFFASVHAPRVHALMRTFGYPQEVARVLTATCTNRFPSARLLAPDVRDKMEWLEQQRYRTRHLPQGAPTSPALANLCAFRLDLRLAGLARALGATYTRYADDLAFSGGEDLARVVERLSVRVAAIALEEGFSIQLRKTRVMRRGARQHLAGVVVNEHPNLARSEFDTLKAILTNCVRHGAASQNREGYADFRAHLQGRVAQAVMLNPQRGAKLKGIFEGIGWAKETRRVRNGG